MYKRSPSRNQRSKGIQIKHILQVFLLVAVCFWLIYQVKHSHDKKREFDDSAKSSLATEQKDGVVKLGRKYLNPRMEDKVVKTGKQDEEEDDETPVEEEDNKHEETEDQEDSKTEEKEEEEEDVDEESNGGDETDDQNQENSDTDNDQEVDFEDEEKERDNVDEQTLKDKDIEDNNGQTENDSVSREHYIEGDITNTREAREENYKADDASSAVTHDTQITIPDNQTRIVGKSNQQAEVNELEHQNQSITPDEVGTGQNPPVKEEGAKTANNGSYLASKTIGRSETATETLNMIEESKVHKNNNNSTAVRIEPQELPLAGWNRTFSEHNQDENVVEGHKNTRNISKFQITDNKQDENVVEGHKNTRNISNFQITDNKLEDSSSTLPGRNDQDDFRSRIYIYSKDIDPSLQELKKSDGSQPSISEVQTNISAKTEESLHDAKDNGATGMNEKLDESYSETSDELQIDPIDSSDTTNSLEEKYIQ